MVRESSVAYKFYDSIPCEEGQAPRVQCRECTTTLTVNKFIEII